MANEWRMVTLGDISCDVTYGYTESASIDRVGPRFLRITDIQNGVVDWHTVPYCQITPEQHEKYRLHQGDIVVARTGNSTGENYLFDSTEDAVFASYLIRFKIDPCKADARFVWFTMRSQYWWTYVNASKTGSAQAGANAKVLRDYPISLPPLPEQRAIAHVLGTLDDKIECNRRLNRTLEGIVRALFKSWFIDFDPVIDNALAAGKPIPDELADRAALRQQAAEEHAKPLPDDLRALFPAEFTHTDAMGWIPKGWSIRALDQVADYMNGLACQKYPVQDGEHGLPVIKIRELRSGISEQTDRATASVPKKYLVEDGDILFSWSGSLLVRPWTEGPGVLNQHLFKVTSDAFPKWFIYLWTDHHLQDFIQIAADKATTMGHIKRDHLTAAKVVVPSGDVLGAADRQLGPAMEKAISVLLQAQALTKLRDTLLPWLLSGEVTVPVAATLTAEADR
ncbi:restriction endonuclease subunit S [Oligosphaera ethanolica]|uniref:Type I restriction enzyme S subunit n=1 Tax=Oligosphaera ethanolica TaxID=760260 RepID=A0AAE3VFF9_9BACT|nr:restriction endonuclease subunit S [Oligosphaera ethanolica]MDQ0289490.1 type I restriction enzyme S subunit [Oligosphaera ethanolica]